MMTYNTPFSTIDELPDFDIEFPEESAIWIENPDGSGVWSDGWGDPDPEDDEDDPPPQTFDPDNNPPPPEKESMDDWFDRYTFLLHDLDDKSQPIHISLG